MRELIQSIFDNYVNYRVHNTDLMEDFLKKFYQDYKNYIYDVLKLDKKRYKTGLSRGSYKNYPITAWFAIYNREITDTAHKGVYIVYLFNKDCSKVYLTLNQGCTEFEKDPNKTDILLNNAKNIRDIISHKQFIPACNYDLGGHQFATDYKNGTILYKEYSKQNIPSEDQLQQDLKDMLEIYEEYYEKIFKQKVKKTVEEEPKSYEGGKQMSETKRQIDQIRKYITNKGFLYEGSLIENFYLSLKSKPFVILAGTSGTGKTRLAKLFAESIGATEDNGQYKLVPVRPDWSDSSDLFGHINLDGKFVPGAIIDFIKTASLPENKEKPYFLCLDEMNLARVEYYMSDFLSVIETRDFNSDKSAIETSALMTLDKYGSDENAKKSYGLIGFPDNLYIIGTVNMDETTFPFSKKVLDRANTIEFSIVNLIPKFNSSTTPVESVAAPNSFLRSNYLKIQECVSAASFVEEWCKKLVEINSALEKASLHVGYRVRDEIMFYMLNNKEAGDIITADEAFDNEIMQKILPRIQGSSQSIKELLCELFKICAGDYTGIQTANNSASEQMQAILENKESVIYKNSAKKIQFMTRRFEEDDFTSYWL